MKTIDSCMVYGVGIDCMEAWGKLKDFCLQKVFGDGYECDWIAEEWMED